MPRLILVLCLFSCSHWLVAQHRPKLFRAILTTTEGEQIDGILYTLTDSSVVLAGKMPEAIDALRAGATTPLVEINAKTIRKIIIRRKGSVGRGVAFGAVVGLVYGLGVAVFTRPIPPTGGILDGLENGIRLGIIYSSPFGGAFYGLFASIIPRKRYLIGGNSSLFRDGSPLLSRFTFQPPQAFHGNPATAAPR